MEVFPYPWRGGGGSTPRSGPHAELVEPSTIQHNSKAAIRKLQMPANGSLDQVPILVAEDEPEMAREIAAQLTSLGYLARISETGAAGLEAARRERAALLIVDHMLNGIDSLSMIETLRKEGIRSPVLVVSALAPVDERIRG